MTAQSNFASVPSESHHSERSLASPRLAWQSCSMSRRSAYTSGRAGKHTLGARSWKAIAAIRGIGKREAQARLEATVTRSQGQEEARLEAGLTVAFAASDPAREERQDQRNGGCTTYLLLRAAAPRALLTYEDLFLFAMSAASRCFRRPD